MFNSYKVCSFREYTCFNKIKLYTGAAEMYTKKRLDFYTKVFKRLRLLAVL